VSSLMLIATAVTARNPPILELLDAVESLEDPVSVEFIREFQSSTIHRAVPTDFFDGVVQSSMKVPASIWKCALRSLVEAGVARVPADCPARILWGDRDGVFSWDEQQVLRRHIPGATFDVFAEVGHALHWEIPAVVVRELAGLPV
jgi:pimeloyl-ACP methyl ester carboxylesterase